MAPVVQTLDSAIHWITQLVLLVFIRWIVIYPLDSAIHRLNNWGLLNNRARQDNCQQFLSIAEPCGYDFIAWLSAAANGRAEYQRLTPYSVQTFTAVYITSNSLV